MTYREFAKKYKKYRVPGRRNQYYVRSKDGKMFLCACLDSNDSRLSLWNKAERVKLSEGRPIVEVMDLWETWLLKLRLSGEVE